MSDNVDDQDVNFSDTGETESAAAPKAKGAGPGLARLLMFVGIGLGAVIFIVTVVVITVGIINGQGKPANVVPVSEAYQAAPPVYQYNSTIGEIRARTNDPEPASVIVRISLGFDLNDKEESKDVTDMLPRIRDWLRSYFSMKSADDLTPDKEQMIKEEIKENLNRILPKPTIREVLFERFDVIKM
ncbi:MAG TPA: flagellar basal body-associated FliL family protein [Rectinemataceae bacterium]|nr:flagellar basal body-associated FliL family protein [Rectinemataceae bacterium]